MAQTETLTRLAAVLADVAGVDPAEVTADKQLADDLELDSLAMVEVTVAVEDTFGAKVPDDVASQFRTVGDVATYLEESHVDA